MAREFQVGDKVKLRGYAVDYPPSGVIGGGSGTLLHLTQIVDNAGNVGIVTATGRGAWDNQLVTVRFLNGEIMKNMHAGSFELLGNV